MEKRIIAFDIGDKRIGVAVTDPFNEYAMPCETYWRTKSFQGDVEQIVNIALARGVGTIVCGLPVNFDGSESVQTEKTCRFIEAIRQKTAIPVVTEDERFTTLQARDVLIEGGVRREKRKNTVDSIAASYILEGYLARIKSEKTKQEEPTMTDQDKQNENNDEDLVTLVDDEGNETLFYHIATVEHKGKPYCVFQLAEPQTEEEEDEVAIYELVGEEPNETLEPIADEVLLEEVFNRFCEEYEEYGEEYEYGEYGKEDS